MAALMSPSMSSSPTATNPGPPTTIALICWAPGPPRESSCTRWMNGATGFHSHTAASWSPSSSIEPPATRKPSGERTMPVICCRPDSRRPRTSLERPTCPEAETARARCLDRAHPRRCRRRTAASPIEQRPGSSGPVPFGQCGSMLILDLPHGRSAREAPGSGVEVGRDSSVPTSTTVPSRNMAASVARWLPSPIERRALDRSHCVEVTSAHTAAVDPPAARDRVSAVLRRIPEDQESRRVGTPSRICWSSAPTKSAEVPLAKPSCNSSPTQGLPRRAAR